MKHLKNLILAIICVFLSSIPAHAQSKVAHINTQELVDSMPKTKEAMAQLQQKNNELQSQVENMIKELEANKIKFDGELKTLAEQIQKEVVMAEQEAKTDSEKKDAQNLGQTRIREYQQEEQNALTKLREQEENIRQYQLNSNNEIQELRNQLIAPILNEVREAIKKVGAAQGFDYVLDSTEGGGVLMAEGKDLTSDVKSELGF